MDDVDDSDDDVDVVVSKEVMMMKTISQQLK